MVAQPPKKFLRRISRALLANQFERLKCVLIFQPLPQCFRQIRHRLPTRHAMHIQPLQQLRNAISRLAPRLKLRRYLICRLRFDVIEHTRNLLYSPSSRHRFSKQGDSCTASKGNSHFRRMSLETSNAWCLELLWSLQLGAWSFPPDNTSPYIPAPSATL